MLVLPTLRFLDRINKFKVLLLTLRLSVLTYSRRKKPVVHPMHVQELKPALSNKVINYTVPSQENICSSNKDNNNDLLIAIRKGIRKCTQYPLYPLSHFMPYDKLSHTHSTFLTHLNTITIPKKVLRHKVIRSGECHENRN